MIKKEANKALLRSISKEEPKMLEWIPDKEHPYSPVLKIEFGPPHPNFA